MLKKKFALAFFICTGFFYWYREPLITTGVDLFLLPPLRDRLGVDLSVGTVSTDLYSQISFNNIVFRSPVDSQQTRLSLTLKQVDFHFHLQDLLEGVTSFLSQSQLFVREGETVVSLVKGKEESSFSLPEDLPVSLKITPPEIIVRDMNIHLSMEDRLFSLQALSGSMKRQSKSNLEYGIQLQTPLCTLEQKTARLWNGPASLDAVWGRKGISIHTLQFNKETILEQLALSKNEHKGGLSAGGKIHLLGIDTTFSATWDNNMASLQVDAKTGKSGESVSRPAGWPLSALRQCNIEADAHLDLRHPEWSRGRFDAQIHNAVIKGVAVKNILINGAMADGLIRLSHLDVQTSGNQLVLTDASFQAAALLQGAILESVGRDSAVFQLSLSDIPSLALLLGNHLPAKKIPSHCIHITGQLNGGELRVKKGNLTVGKNSLNISTGILTPPTDAKQWRHAAFTLNTDILLPDPAVITSFLDLPDVKGTAEGHIELSGSAAKLRGQFHLSGNGLRYNDITLERLQVDGRLDEKGDLQGNLQTTSSENSFGDLATTFEASLQDNRLWCKQLRLDGPYGKGEASLEFLFAKKEVAATVHSLDLSRQGSNMHLIGPARMLLKPDSFVFTEPFNITGDAGTIKLNGGLGHKQSALTIEGQSLNSGHWLDGILSKDIGFNNLNLKVTLKGSIEKPYCSVSARVKELFTAGSPLVFGGEIDADYTSSGLQIKKFQWHDTATANSLHLEGFLPLVLQKKIELLPAPISLTADIDLSNADILSAFFPNTLQSGGSILGQMRLQGTWNQPNGSINLRAKDLRPSPSMDWLPPDPLSLQCLASVTKSEVQLTTLSIASPGLHLNLAGSWSFADNLLSILQDQKDILSGNLDVSGKLVIGDIGWLAQKFSAIRSMTGRCEAQLLAKGPADNPLLEADLHLNGGRLRLDADFPVLQAMDIKAKLKPDGLFIHSVEGQLGGAPFHLAGDVLYGQGKELRLALILQGKNLLLYRNESLRLRADTDISLEGPYSQLTLAGTLRVKDSMYIKNVSLLNLAERKTPAPNSQRGIQLFSIVEPPLSNMKINVAISTGEPFLLKNNLVNGTLRTDLMLTGTGKFPELQGVVYLDPIRVALPAGSLTVDSGTVRFPVNNPEFPELDINASSRMMGYDVSVQISGRYNEPVVTLSSSPTLPDEELLLMLLTGIRPKSESGSMTASAGGNIALYFSKGLLASWFKKEGDDPTANFLDRLEVDVGQAVTKQGEDTIEAQLRIAEGVFRTNDTVYLKTEKDVYDQYNTGVRIVFRFR